MILTEALKQYFGSRQGSVSQEMQVELQRFLRWFGVSRDAQNVVPSDVAEYTGSLAVSGGDVQERLAAIRDFLAYLERQKLITHSLASAVKVSRAKTSQAGGPRLGYEPVYLTRDGYDTLQQELRTLKSQRGSIAEDIRHAAADKDVRENAPLEAAREHKGHVESRIRELENRLQRAVVMGKNGQPVSKIKIGHQVVLRNTQTDKDMAYTLVDPAEVDSLKGKISVASPMGKALLGRSAGQQVQVAAPRGNLLYEIVEVKQ